MKKSLKFLRLILLATLIFTAVGPVSIARAAGVILVQSTGDTGTTPTPTDNDFTRIDNAIHALSSGDTLKLKGTFNFGEANAMASWVKGNDGIAGGAYGVDDYEVDVPANLNNVTLTADYLGAATIQGPGDVPAVDLEGFLQFYNAGTNQNWTISNLRILDFDLSIGLFWLSGPSNHFDGFKITNNYIRIATDLKGASSTGPESAQNIGIHLASGQNQTVSYNTIDIPGDGLSDATTVGSDWWTYGATPGWLYSSNVALQSNTHGGTAYNGLLIDHNTVQVLNAQSANPARIIGIWENGWAHNSNVTVSNNQFVNLAAGNDPTLNRQMAFRPTSHSSASTTVKYYNNTVQGASIGFAPMDGTVIQLPIVMNANTLTDVNTGFLLGSKENYLFTNNTLTNSGVGTGIKVPSTAVATVGSAAGSNTISGFATGIDANGGNATISNNTLTGNGTAVLVESGGIATLHSNNISGNSGYGVNNTTGVDVDATYNWWGSANGACKPADQPTCTGFGNKVSVNVIVDPFANALVSSTTASTHEVGETGTLDTHVTVTGLYGAQLRVNHDNSVLNFASGVHNDVASTLPWAWDIVAEDFITVTGGHRVSGSMSAGAGHSVGANLTGQSIATWNYTCAAPGTSSLTYDTSTGTGSYLADINGFAIPAAFTGDSITCLAQTASVDGYIKLQGRLGTNPVPAGWNDATVTLTCVSGGCAGYGPYILTTDATGHYQLVKSGAGTGIVLGTYSASVTRRAYLGAAKAANVTISAGSNTINTTGTAPTLLGGDVTGDQSIGIGDLAAIGGAFGSSVTADTGNDVNGDGFVNIFDLVMVGGNYNLTTSSWTP